MRIGGLRKRKQGIGVDTGDGSALGKGHSDVGEGDVLREFGDDEDIKRAQGEEGGLELSAKFFNGVADGFKAIMGIAEEPFTSVCGVADLMAIEGHAFATFLGVGLMLSHGAPREMSCQERKKEKICQQEVFPLRQKVR